MSALYLIFSLYLLPKIINTGNVGPLDLLFWYNHNTLYMMFSSYGEAIRNIYKIGLLTADVIYPIFYGTLLAMIIALVQKKLTIPFSRRIIFIPFVAVFFDFIENALLVFLLNIYPNKNMLVADIAGYVTATKWCAFGIIPPLIIYLIIYGIRNRKRKSQNQ